METNWFGHPYFKDVSEKLDSFNTARPMIEICCFDGLETLEVTFKPAFLKSAERIQYL